MSAPFVLLVLLWSASSFAFWFSFVVKIENNNKNDKIIMITEARKIKIDCVLMFLEWHLVF